MFDSFKKQSKAKVTRTRKAKSRSPKRFDLLVVDGDVLSPGKMARRKELARFARRHRWVLALDVGTRHHRRALERETGFGSLSEDGDHESDAFLFRRERPGTSQRVRGPLLRLAVGSARRSPG